MAKSGKVVAVSVTRVRAAWPLGFLGVAAVVGAMAPKSAQAGDRLLGTWGVSQVEGAAGGGLTPWATVGGSGSSNQVGGSVYSTRLRTKGGYELKISGAAIGVNDRVELSMARWSFRLADDVVPDKSLEMTVAGLKVKVAGDAVYDQDHWMPQVSVGVHYKAVDDDVLVSALGATDSTDMDAYVSATKLWLGVAGGLNVLASGTVRLTRANHFGLVGFGGPGNEHRQLMLEGSVGLMLRDNLVLGAEYRAKPDNLRTGSAATATLREDPAWDYFVAWFPTRQLNVTAAWVNLGNIVGKRDQAGLYLSGQVAF